MGELVATTNFNVNFNDPQGGAQHITQIQTQYECTIIETRSPN